MINRVAVVALAVVLWASSAQAQLVTSGEWVPVIAAGNDGSTPFSNPSWDGPAENLSFRLGNGVEWLRDPVTGGLARWTWAGWANLALTDLGGTSEFIGQHYMEYAGAALGLTAGLNHYNAPYVAWSAPPDGGPNTGAVLVRYRVPGTYTINYAVFFEDLHPSFRDGDFQDRGVGWSVTMDCAEVVLELQARIRQLEGQ